MRPSTGRRRRLATLGALAAGAPLALAGCTGNAATVQAKSVTPYLTWTGHTVHLELIAGAPEGPGGFDFNGASAGAMTVTVPVGWDVHVLCMNYSAELTHSCNIVQASSAAAAFPGSVMRDAREGLPPGKVGAFSFTATKAGSYQIVCLVSGHRDAGMWDRFDVRKSIGKPTIRGAIGIPNAP